MGNGWIKYNEFSGILYVNVENVLFVAPTCLLVKFSFDADRVRSKLDILITKFYVLKF